MRCPACQRPMLALFTSYVCDYCDGDPAGDFYRGWVVWPAGRDETVQTWVFRTRADADKWRQSRTDGTVRAVLSEQPFTWTRSRGSVKDVELAEKPFEIFPDHRHPTAPYRAFIAPEAAPDTERVHLVRRRR